MRYLIVKTSAFGDIIHAYGALEYLKKLDPNAQIDWVVEKRMASLVKSHPFVSNTIEVDTKSWRSNVFTKGTWQDIARTKRMLQEHTYDAVFDLQGNIKSGLITFLAKSKNKIGFGFKKAPEAISALSYTHRYNPPAGQNIRSDYLFLLESYFGKKCTIDSPQLLKICAPIAKHTGNWLIAPGSNWKNKQLTQETLIAFLEQCKNTYNPNFVFLCGTDAEHAQAQMLAKKFSDSEILYKPDLPSLQHIMASMQLVVSMDSLPLHLAAAAGCKTYSFFGPSSSQKYNPLGVLHGSIQGACPYNQTFERRCSKLRTCPTGACLRQLDSSMLFTSFRSWYEG